MWLLPRWSDILQDFTLHEGKWQQSWPGDVDLKTKFWGTTIDLCGYASSWHLSPNCLCSGQTLRKEDGRRDAMCETITKIIVYPSDEYTRMILNCASLMQKHVKHWQANFEFSFQQISWRFLLLLLTHLGYTQIKFSYCTSNTIRVMHCIQFCRKIQNKTGKAHMSSRVSDKYQWSCDLDLGSRSCKVTWLWIVKVSK